ncbi:response regulator [Mesorhizobium sp. BR1-1-16]|uniref:response regulator n=1 Tax=Mesorhizobium sp. BR1-1-16 TaxID=2876653 RepID=UPI001CCE18CF|nr:response regulator [Mesorhizobium sp. BR1-1-16]MBZ9938655.1 response regulator [Mesorhizobium sp. BR1-1-16]
MQADGFRLIIVEDEPIIAMMVEEMAIELGWRVEGLADSEAGAAALLNTSKPDLALLDIHLGSDSGLRVAEICRGRGVPVVFMTGYPETDIPPRCGDAPILLKPFLPAELGRAAKRSLQSGSATSPCDHS